MLELARTEVGVIGCFASAGALDAVRTPKTVAACRVASDELLLIGAPGSVARLASSARKRMREVEDDALVLDVTDGWTVWTLDGEDAHDAFSRLSMLELPAAGVAQGDVARLPVKIVVDGKRLHLAVPSSWAAYLRERILGLALELREDAEPRAWRAPKGGSA